MITYEKHQELLFKALQEQKEYLYSSKGISDKINTIKYKDKGGIFHVCAIDEISNNGDIIIKI